MSFCSTDEEPHQAGLVQAGLRAGCESWPLAFHPRQSQYLPQGPACAGLWDCSAHLPRLPAQAARDDAGTRLVPTKHKNVSSVNSRNPEVPKQRQAADGAGTQHTPEPQGRLLLIGQLKSRVYLRVSQSAMARETQPRVQSLPHSRKGTWGTGPPSGGHHFPPLPCSASTKDPPRMS